MESKTEENVKATIHKIVSWLSGETNDRINSWVDADEESFKNIIKFMDNCASNGWDDLKVSPLDYATPETVEIANGLYERAINHFGGGK